jgi:hypothetical protein
MKVAKNKKIFKIGPLKNNRPNIDREFHRRSLWHLAYFENG